MENSHMGLSIILLLAILLSLLVVSTVPIFKNQPSVTRKIYLVLIALSIISGILSFPYYILIIAHLVLLYKLSNALFGKANDNGRIRSKRGLRTWVVLSLLVVAIGTGAAVVQFNNPSMQDQYYGRDSSAIATVIATLVAAMFMGIGMRVSYKKYARFDQAALIADAIKTQIQSSGTNTAPVLSKSQDTEERLRKLESLLANGLISQEEYSQKKKEIIDSI